MKLYTDEPGHEDVRSLENLVVAQIARVEVPSAIWGKRRLGDLSAADAQDLATAFEDDWSGHEESPPRFAIVALSAGVLEDAARFCAVHGLRAYDAVQLSSAVAARRTDPDCRAVVAFDRSLRAAASGEGFSLIPRLDD